MEHTITRLVRVSAQEGGLSCEATLGKMRGKKFTRVRLAVMLVATELGYSSSNIGSRLGGRHHTTVLSGVRRAKKLLDGGDAALAALVTALREEVGNGVQG